MYFKCLSVECESSRPTKLRSEKQRDRPVMDDWPFWFLGVAYAFLCFVTVPSPFLNS